jgi:hypothetical protein
MENFSPFLYGTGINYFNRRKAVYYLFFDQDAKRKIISQGRREYHRSGYLVENSYRAESKGSRENR